MVERRFGPFRLERLLGQGGMGEVWLAVRPGHPPVALKRLQDQRLATMFEDEARVLSQLRHPGVVRVHGLHREGEHLALEMELLRGPTLFALQRRLFAEGRQMPVEGAVAIGAQLAEAISHLHRRDIVHRDVAPQNVIIEPEGRVVLLDFGIAWAQARKTRTAIGVIKGRPAFMAPEQAAGGTVGPKADVYALGVLLWELLAGRPLHARENHVFEALRRPEAPPLRSLRAEVPLRLSALIQAMLVQDEGRRIHSKDCLEVLQAHAGSMDELAALIEPRKSTAAKDATPLASTTSGLKTGASVPEVDDPAGTGPTAVLGPPSGPTTAPEGPLISWSMGQSDGLVAPALASTKSEEKIPMPGPNARGDQVPRSRRSPSGQTARPVEAASTEGGRDLILWTNALLFLLVLALFATVLLGR